MMVRYLFVFFFFTNVFAVQVREGVFYEHITTEHPCSVHILRVDPSLVEIRPVRAWNFGLGRESLSSIAKRTGAIAAVNAGFFEVNGNMDGRPVGALKIDGQWFSIPSKLRGAVGWSSCTVPIFDRLLVNMEAEFPSGVVTIRHLNSPRSTSDVVLYSWVAQRTTLTCPGGTEVSILGDRVTSVVTGQGDSPIPEGGWVLSFGEDMVPPVIEKGMRVSIKIGVVPQVMVGEKDGWDGADHIIGGAPLLIKNAQACMDIKKERTREGFGVDCHPRTVVGTLSNGHWIFVVVEGRLLTSRGMTIPEITALMSSLGCINALNLDGGRSSSMAIGPSVMNPPIGDENNSFERRISDAIVILPPKEIPA